MTEVKICGLVSLEDIDLVNEHLPDYIGMVLFYPKSKRNITEKQAIQLLKSLDTKIQSVAVVVSPTLEQLKKLEEMGFDYVQIHGTINEDWITNEIKIPIFMAMQSDSIQAYKKYQKIENVVGYVFDGAKSGSGKTFDWSLLKQMDTGKKQLILAGGIDSNNVSEAIKQVNPDVIDVSSGVEKESGTGKDSEKVKTLIAHVRRDER